jgi:site-specific recombinase XerD
MEEECRILSKQENKKWQADKLRMLNKLDEYYKYGMISSKRQSARKEYLFKGGIGDSVKDYLHFRSTSVSEARLKSIKIYLERFCEYTDSISVSSAHHLNVEIIQGFMKSCCIYTKSTIASTAGCLRGYLEYLHVHGISKSNLSIFIPYFPNRKESLVPSAYSAEDVENLLSCVDRDHSRGKRDYAMLLLAARLGLRSSDICGLEFSSIDWERNQINIIQQKTGDPASYPLLEDVGLAIIDYLKNGRVSTPGETHVFLRESPPYTRLVSGSLYNITDRYMKRARIYIPRGKHHGPHALRHSLSSRLLENDIPLTVISAILAHKSTETTKVYLKIAEKQLVECALEVPSIVKEA